VANGKMESGSQTQGNECPISMMNSKKNDHLYVLAIAPKVTTLFMNSYISDKLDSMIQDQEKIKSKTLLSAYGNLCRKKRIAYTCMLGVSNSVGEFICDTVTEKNIHFLVLGRRGLSPVKRIFVGSTSKYCLENANCNVVIVKEEYTGEVESDEEVILPKNPVVHKVGKEDDKVKLEKEVDDIAMNTMLREEERRKGKEEDHWKVSSAVHSAPFSLHV